MNLLNRQSWVKAPLRKCLNYRDTCPYEGTKNGEVVCWKKGKCQFKGELIKR